MPNRLADEHSPYLLQHKDNPVDWYPWGDAAFEKAKAEDKPVFLSIGYSTCHWCHVMERESFEDEAVAQLMNEAFVSVKVDREERPDIDSLYMTVCQLMGQQGGWPLNVLLTPEGEPFHAMTYLPKESRFGRMGMTEFVPRIRGLWQDERARVLKSAGSITEALAQSARQTPTGAALDEGVLENAFEQFSGRFDAAQGGFGSAPKFPSPHTLLFLLRYARRTGQDRPRRMVEKTLDAMRLGGIFDHVGFGFHRYSTDARWLVPHFEKMLYDQAMLALAYTEGFQVTGNAAYEQTAREIFAYVLRDMTDEAGGFYSAEDADSEGREGAFYLWTIGDIREALSEEQAALVMDVYNLEEDGNFAEEASGQKTGENILHLRHPLHEIAAAREMDEAALREKLEAARRTLFAHREERERPGLDDKILTDWNGLFIAALAKAARVFDAPELTEAAEKAASFLLETMRDDEGRLLHRYRGGEAAIRAQLDDYAFLAFGCIELYETTYEVRWLRAALDLMETLRARFLDEEHGGFFLTADDGEPLLVRQKGFYDGAIPSGNSVALLNLLRLARLTGRADLEEEAHRLTQAAAAQVRRQPSGFAALLCGLDFALGPAFEVVVAGDPEADDTAVLLRALAAAYTPNAVTLLRPDAPAQEAPPEIATLAPFTEGQRAVEGQAAAYVCQAFQCQAPTTDADEMLAALEGR